MFARECRLIPQSIGLSNNKSSAGVELIGTHSDDWTTPMVRIGNDGSILTVNSVEGTARSLE